MNSFEIFRSPSTLIAVIPADKNTTFSKISAGNATLVFYDERLVNFLLWDFVTLEKVNYYFNKMPEISKIGSLYRYNFNLSTSQEHKKGWLNH